VSPALWSRMLLSWPSFGKTKGSPGPWSAPRRCGCGRRRSRPGRRRDAPSARDRRRGCRGSRGSRSRRRPASSGRRGPGTGTTPSAAAVPPAPAAPLPAGRRAAAAAAVGLAGNRGLLALRCERCRGPRAGHGPQQTDAAQTAESSHGDLLVVRSRTARSVSGYRPELWRRLGGRSAACQQSPEVAAGSPTRPGGVSSARRHGWCETPRVPTQRWFACAG